MRPLVARKREPLAIMRPYHALILEQIKNINFCFGRIHRPHKCEVRQTFGMPIGPWTPRRSQSLAKLAAKGDSSYLYATAIQ